MQILDLSGENMKWFRMYNDILDDPKIAQMSAQTFKTFSFLLAFCSSLESQGTLSLLKDDPVWRFRMRKNAWNKAIKELLKLDIIKIEGDILHIINWDKRQYKSSDSNERVKLYRKRRIEEGLTSGVSYNRTAIFKRDNYLCVYCGSQKNLCVDHVWPIIQGGDDNELNLVTACKKCNSGKAGRTPEQANYSWFNMDAKNRIKKYMLQLQNKNVTVTVTPPDTETETDTDTETETDTDIPEKKSFSDDVISLANIFSTNLPKRLWPKNGAKERWLNTLDKCIRIDGYTFEQVKEIIETYRSDSFWQTNFLSPAKLRQRNKDGIKYIDYFWNILENQEADSMTPEERKIREHNLKAANELGIKIEGFNA